MMETMVIVDAHTDELIGYALYFGMYDLQTGFGAYLEDLFIREPYRRLALGTTLWKRVASDCIRMGARYMQWTVLSWNTSAIKLYHKFNAVNITQLRGLHFYRFFTQLIYKNSK